MGLSKTGELAPMKQTTVCRFAADCYGSNMLKHGRNMPKQRHNGHFLVGPTAIWDDPYRINDRINAITIDQRVQDFGIKTCL